MLRPFIYLIAKLIALLAPAILLLNSGADIIFVIISVLAFACIFLVQVLFSMIKTKLPKSKITKVLMVTSALGCFLVSIEDLFPLFIVLIVEIIDDFTQDKMFYQLLAVSLFLAVFIFTPSLTLGIITLIILPLLIISIELEKRLKIITETNSKITTILAEQNKKIAQIKSYSKTIQATAAMEERNRFTVKIHDKLGHGISGSIIMLEAALLSLETNPEQAEKNIRTATTSLRQSVDDIRIVLREERPRKTQLGIAEIKQNLEEFELSFNISTRLKSSGDLDKISHAIWICIHQNLSEALTNVLKHSKANTFTLKISVLNKIIKVEFHDNGNTVGNIKYGLGLEAIEERTANTGGKMLIQNDINGFSMINIFNI